MIRRVIAFVLVAMFAFNAQAAKPPVLPTPLGERMPVEIVFNQQELSVDVPDTSSMGAQFGLIGALISSGMDNAAAKKAEERVAPLRNALISYPFNERLEAALRAKLPSEGISAEPQISVVPSTWDAADAQNAASRPAYAMVITPRYAMDTGFNHLYVNLTALIVDRTVNNKGKVKVKVRASRHYTFSFPIESGKAEQNVAVWQSIPSAPLATMLDEAIRHSVDMLVYDFSPQGRSEWALKVKKTKATLGTRTFAGSEVRKGTDWLWVRGGLRGMNGGYGGFMVVGFNDGIVGYKPIDPAALQAQAPLSTPVTQNASVQPTGVQQPTPKEGASDQKSNEQATPPASDGGGQ